MEQKKLMDLEVALTPLTKNEEHLLKGGFGEVSSFEPLMAAAEAENANYGICLVTCNTNCPVNLNGGTKCKKSQCTTHCGETTAAPTPTPTPTGTSEPE